MRISDRSSDVCSSDLPARTTGCSPAFPAEPARGSSTAPARHQGVAHRRLLFLLVQRLEDAGDVEIVLAEMLAREAVGEAGADAVRQDRQIVVYGNRVSDSVDFGRRRLIKKKHT